MTQRPKALIAWSSGKDSAWALHEVRRAGDYDIVAALTTVTDTFARVSMHGVREELLRAQLDAAGLPSIVVRIPFPCTNDIYEREMAAALAQAKSDGVTHVIFGDLFLADLRAYREAKARADRHDRRVSALAATDRQAGAGDDRCRRARRISRPSIWRNSHRLSRAGASTTRCSRRCRRASTRAARMASFIPS